MSVGAVGTMSAISTVKHVLDIWWMPELALFSMCALAMTIFDTWRLAFFSIGRPTCGALVAVLAFRLSLVLALALAFSGIAIAVHRMAGRSRS